MTHVGYVVMVVAAEPLRSLSGPWGLLTAGIFVAHLIVLACMLFAETPSAWIVPGGAAILAGIYLVTRTGEQTEVVPE
jgi:hypothetical protein